MTLRTITFDDSTHKLVPIIATSEMVHTCRLHHEGDEYLPYSLYASMIEAAPEYQEPELRDISEQEIQDSKLQTIISTIASWIDWTEGVWQKEPRPILPSTNIEMPYPMAYQQAQNWVKTLEFYRINQDTKKDE